jgi:hypothetical protein
VRRSDDGGARNPAAQAAHAGEGFGRDRSRVGVARVRRNDAAALRALSDLSGGKKIADGLA